MSNDLSGARVLLQERDPDLRRVVAESLEQQGWEVDQAEGKEEALAALQHGPYPAVLIVECDLTGGGSADEVIERYRDGAENGRVLVTTEERPNDEWRRNVQPDAVVYKPFDTRYLIKSIDSLAEPIEG